MWKFILGTAVLIGLSTGNVYATVVGNYTAGEFLGPGIVENLHNVEMTAFAIDLTLGIGPVWNISSRQDGLNLSNPIASGDGFFTATFFDLNILPGQSFEFLGLDYDGTEDGTNITNNGINSPLDGSEIVRMIFADGSTASANLFAGPPIRVSAQLELDSEVSTVPAPATLPLLITALAYLGFVSISRKQASNL